MSQTLFISNDNALEMGAVLDVVNTTFLNAGTATFRVYSVDGVTEETPEQTLSYVASSNGIYRGILDTTDVPSAGEYEFRWVFVEGAFNARWSEPGVVMERDT